MRKLIVMLAALAGCATTFAADEKTDVTASYLKNASFENDNIAALQQKTESADGLRGYIVSSPTGWTVNNGANAVSLIVTKDCFTDNNFGKVTTLAGGAQAYYLRQGWSGGTTTVRQTLTALPKGKYQLMANVRSAYANSATSTLNFVAGKDAEDSEPMGTRVVSADVKLGVPTVTKFDVFSLNGQKIASFVAHSLAEASKIWQSGSVKGALKTEGVCLIRSRSTGTVAKVRALR